MPTRRRLPPSGFRNLPAVCSRRHLAGLFHPAGTCRLPPSGPSPPKEPYRLSATVAFLPLPLDLLPLAEAKGRRTGFRALLPSRVRCSSRVRLSSPEARCPPGVPPLQGAPSSSRGPCFHAPPLPSFDANRTGRFVAGSPGSCRPEARLASREVADPPGVYGLVEPLIRSNLNPGRAYRFASGSTRRHRSPGSPL